MNHWEETAVLPLQIQTTVVKYDPYKPLVWIGDANGVVKSFHTPLLLPYTSFVASKSAILDIQVSDKYVISLAEDGVRAFSKEGVLHASNKRCLGVCMLLLNDSEFLVGVNQKVKRYSLEPEIKETGFFHLDCIPDGVRVQFMKLCSPNIALGLSNGCLQIVEPFTFDNIIPEPAVCHRGSIIDMDARKNLVVTCGLTTRKFGRIFPDVFASCFDTRLKRAIQPFASSSGASFVRLHPKSPNHTIVLSASGSLTFMDNKNPNSISIKQLILHGNLVGMDISGNGHALAIAENNCLHHWLASPNFTEEDNRFRGLQVPTSELPVNTNIELTNDDDTDAETSNNIPLSAIGMPFYKPPLLSDWNHSLIYEVGNPVPNWDTVKSSLIYQSHAHVLGNRGRASSTSVPRFLSEKERLGLSNDDNSAFVDLMKSDDSALRGKVPKIWRQMHIHYSKFGVDDFDFSFYNSTDYAGLETLSENVHLNALLQLYRWCTPMFNRLLRVFARYNYLELTTTGELAIVLDMLSKAGGNHFRATNFVDTLKLGDLDIHELHAHLISTMSKEQEEEQEIPKGEFVDGVSFLEMHRKEYGSCGYVNQMQSTSTQLIAEDATLTGLQGCFSRSSLDVVYCPKCAKQHSVVVSEKLCSTPNVLFVSVKPKGFHYGQQGNSMVKNFGIQASVNQNMLIGLSSDDYMLKGYVAEINNEGQKHSVTVVNTDRGWHLFNDFLVTPLSEEDALDLKSHWKNPSLLMYVSKTVTNEFDDGWKRLVDTRLLYNKMCTSGNVEEELPESEMLKHNESVPESVSLDAEFVLLKNEVAEMHSDGSKTLISPRKFGLARISIVRDDGSVFFDDWVESNQPILDYFTTYSGVEDGDLDPERSRFALVPRRVATRRLWILLNLGTKFIGHALINDFRTINLFVPKEQVIDTINLFYDRDRNGFRRLSLKFLMWAVLNMQVQTGNHDSVQDAQSALMLYKEYKHLRQSGNLDGMLEDLAAKGIKNNYKVPSSNGDDSLISLPGTPRK